MLLALASRYRRALARKGTSDERRDILYICAPILGYAWRDAAVNGVLTQRYSTRMRTNGRAWPGRSRTHGIQTLGGTPRPVAQAAKS